MQTTYDTSPNQTPLSTGSTITAYSCGTATGSNLPPLGRFAPTPSGRMHLGNVYSLLASWLAARSQGGMVRLRIEDLDPRAQNPAATKQLIEDLCWLGLEWDGSVVYQSQRTRLYQSAFDELRAQGLVYPCFCSRSELHAATAPHASDGNYIYAGTCRNLTTEQQATRALSKTPSWRLRVPDKGDSAGIITFTDLVCGHQEEDLASTCGDFVLRRADGVFAYQLAVVIDDADMGVTQVVRGNDLLSSVARQSYLQQLLHLPMPAYGHVPLLVAPDGRRLSKRDKDLDLGALRARGVAPRQILALLGSWLGLAPASEQLELEALIGKFNWQRVASMGDKIVVQLDGIFD